MSKPLRIQYPDAPPASLERLAIAAGWYREPVVPYGANFTLENGLLRLQEGCFLGRFY